ncbi:SLBB domain-containing protein [Gammaproteobacteria bacterium]|nr:SLBB domain-containing protein [Gammaproteobacteria bacterium]
MNKSITTFKASVFFLMALFTVIASAQNASLTQSSMQMLEQLSPSERQRALQELTDSSELGVDQPIEFPELIVPIEEEIEGVDEGEDLEEAELELGFFEQEIILEPFGNALFEGAPTTFAPATDIPVPPEYKIGPGDTIDVQLFGKENRQYSLVVNRDGTINFPDVGPINVVGLSFEDLKQQILDRVANTIIGTSAAISMGALRSIQIFVLGDARRPGSYTVSGLSNITNALFVSGGISEIGSLRKVQLKRSGKLVQTLDLYDLLINGNTQNDVRLQSGDVIFIPPIGPTVGIGGYVKRPAIYELIRETTAGEAIELAGGLLANGFPGRTRIERITADWELSFLNLDLTTAKGQKSMLKNGDTLLVPPVLARYKDGIQLAGHVLRPGDFEWREGMQLTDIITSLAELKPQADINYVLIRRETWPDKRVKALSANLEAALANPDSDNNILLEPRDVIRVFDLASERAGTEADVLEEEPLPTDIQILADELRLQATAENPLEIVTIGGKVRAPGNYPFEDGMRLSDLILAGANLAEGAYVEEAELSRFEIIDNTIRRTKVIKVYPIEALAGKDDADILLEPYDTLQIRQIQEWREQLSINIEGEVRFPGRYSFNTGDTLASVIERAGGLTAQSFPEGGIFLREELREREEIRIAELSSKIESDLASLTLQAANENAAVQDAQNAGAALLTKLRNTEATGRLVINLPKMLAAPENPSYMVLLKQNDKLMIPSITQSVTVIGEVQFPTSHLYSKALSRNDYINQSGGETQNAEKKRIYVVRANGAVLNGRVKISAGDTIVVPLDTNRVSKLQLWANITEILFNLSIVVAAVNSF